MYANSIWLVGSKMSPSAEMDDPSWGAKEPSRSDIIQFSDQRIQIGHWPCSCKTTQYLVVIWARRGVCGSRLAGRNHGLRIWGLRKFWWTRDPGDFVLKHPTWSFWRSLEALLGQIPLTNWIQFIHPGLTKRDRKEHDYNMELKS